MKKPDQLTEKIFIIDGHDLSLEERTGCYVLMEQDITLIETSASPSVRYILNGLKELGVSPLDVKNIIVTHIHLDHSGGAGLLLQHCPNAKVIVHPKGARHLADPSRLIASAKTVYGEKFNDLFDPIVPIPQERLIVKDDHEMLTINDNTVLTFIDSPGHANHHFSIHHSGVNGIFTGDTAGISYPQLHQRGIEYYIPTTSPNQFDPDKMLHSINKFKEMNADLLFFGHYGMTENPQEAYTQVEGWLEIFVSEAKEAFDAENDFQDRVNLTSSRLFAKMQQDLNQKGINKEDPIFQLISLDLEISAMGLIDYLAKKKS